MPLNKSREDKTNALMAIFVSSFTAEQESVQNSKLIDWHSTVMLLAQQCIEWQHVLDITLNGTSNVWIKCCISQRALQPFLHWEGSNCLATSNKEKS